MMANPYINYPNEYIEWSLSNIYSDIIADDLKDFNHERSFKILNENELDYILDMMEARYKDFKGTDLVKPFYLKAGLTFRKLGENLGLSPIQIDILTEPFKEMTIDVTISMLKKLKKLFYNRNVIVNILKDIKQRELYSTLIKDKIREIITLKHGNINDPEFQKTMCENLLTLNDIGLKIIGNVKKLYTDGMIFSNLNHKNKMLFKFANKDYVAYINHDMQAISDLLRMLQVVSNIK